MVVELTYLTWADDNLLRKVVFDGMREDKSAQEVVQPVPHPKATRVIPRKPSPVPGSG